MSGQVNDGSAKKTQEKQERGENKNADLPPAPPPPPPPPPGSKTPDLAAFTYFPNSNRVCLVINPSKVDRVELSESLAYLLGFAHLSISQTHIADYEPAIRPSGGIVFVHADCIQPSIVGERRTNLLRVVPTKSQQKGFVSHSIEHVHYFPVLYSRLDSIQIAMTDPSGQEIPFVNDGTTVVVLHFRPMR